MPLDRFQSIDASLLGIKQEHRVLDLGCGTGRHVLELAKGQGSILGGDLSLHDLRAARYLLEIMRRRGEVHARVHWLQTAGERLPFADGAFDRVLCTETLEHVDDDSVLAAELVRVLKPGGILAVSVPDQYSEKIFWKLSPNYRTQVGGHVRIYRRGEIVELLRCAGLDPYAVRYRHSLETLYWLGHIAFWSEWGKQGPITGAFRRALDSTRARQSRIVTAIDDIGNRILPKSIVVYARKPPAAPAATNGTAGERGIDDLTKIASRRRERIDAQRADPTREGNFDAGRTHADDDRSTVEVRAVPAPFAIVPPSTATERKPRPAPLSLADELRLTLTMSPEDQKRRLIEILRSCRFGMMREVQDLTGEQAATPWTEDGRSMKEIVGHISAWERWTASALEEIEQGMAEPGIMSLSGYREGISRYGSVDAFNGARMAEAREMPWSQIMEQSAAAFESLIEIAERTPASSLARTASFYWPALGATVPCGFYLLMVSAHHYEAEHRGEVSGSQSLRTSSDL